MIFSRCVCVCDVGAAFCFSTYLMCVCGVTVCVRVCGRCLCVTVCVYVCGVCVCVCTCVHACVCADPGLHSVWREVVVIQLLLADPPGPPGQEEVHHPPAD